MNNNMGRLVRCGFIALLFCLSTGVCFGSGWNMDPGPTDLEQAYKVHQVDILKNRFGCVMAEVSYPPDAASRTWAAQRAADLQYSEFRIKVVEQLATLPDWWKENEKTYEELVAAWKRAKRSILENK